MRRSLLQRHKGAPATQAQERQQQRGEEEEEEQVADVPNEKHPRQVHQGLGTVVAPNPGHLHVAEGLVAQVDVQVASKHQVK